MNDDINRAIRKAAGREQIAPQTKEAVVDEHPNAVMNDILRAAAGVPNRLGTPPTNDNSAQEKK